MKKTGKKEMGLQKTRETANQLRKERGGGSRKGESLGKRMRVQTDLNGKQHAQENLFLSSAEVPIEKNTTK